MEENTENSLKSNSGKWQIVKNVIYTINHMLIAFNTSYLTWHCFQAGFSDATTWHALLLTVGVSWEAIFILKFKDFAYDTSG